MTETTYRNILALPYEDLTLAERVNSLSAARTAGAEAAAADRGAAGGIESVTAPTMAYFWDVIEPASDAYQINDDLYYAWRDDARMSEGDPRLAAFAEGWEASMREALEDFLDDDLADAASAGSVDAAEGGWGDATDDEDTQTLAQRASEYYMRQQHPDPSLYTDADDKRIRAAFIAAFISRRREMNAAGIHSRTA